MEMCYDGTLVMPSSYVFMSEDEMMYLDGGGKPKLCVYGVYWALSNSQVNKIVKAYNLGAGVAAIASALSAMGVVTAIGSAPAALVSAALWTSGAALDFMNELGGNKGLKLRVFWNGSLTILPV